MIGIGRNFATRATSLLQRNPRLPILLLVLLPFLVHLPQWLLPIHSDPLWQFSFLTKGIKHTWLPGQAYLDPYIAFTSQSFGRLIAWDWFHGILPWWNPYVGIGVPLAGQMQPGAFFLPFVLLLALPGGLTLLTICIQIICGLSMYGLLRELKLGTLAAFTGGGLYALNGTIAWAPGPAAVYCTLAFFPLLLWGIERARVHDRGASATVAVAVAIAYSLLAGFPETAYLNGLLGLGWAILRFAQSRQRWMFAQRIILGGTLGLLLAAPLLVAFAHELASTDMLTGHLAGLSYRPLRSLAMVLLPTIFGPINSGSFGATPMAGVWGAVGGYSSALMAFLAVLSFARGTPERALRLFLLGCVVITLLKTFGFPPAMALVNALPTMQLVAFDRYCAPCWELALIVLASFGLENIRQGRQWRSALTIALLLVVVSIVLGWPARRWSSLPGLSLSLWLAFTGLWAVILPVLTSIASRRLNQRPASFTAAGLLLLDASLLFCLPQCVGLVDGELDLSAARFLQSHAGLSRVVTLGPLTPNYGAYFGFAELNHNMSPIPKAWLDHINTRLLPDFMNVDGGVTFWPIKQAPLDAASAALALQQHLAEYQDLNVRYVVSSPGQEPAPALLLDTPKGRGVAVSLAPGQSITIAASTPDLKQPLREIGFLIKTFDGRANGNLAVRVCSGEECRSGRSSVDLIQDGMFVFASLNAPLPLRKDASLQIRVVHETGSAPVGLWMWPGQPGSAQVIEGPSGAVPSSIRLGFRDSSQVTTASRVFVSKVADVWELPGPKPYFDSQGSCRLQVNGRERLDANCKEKSVLIRREFFMSGWQASINGVFTQVRPHGAVLQEITLPPGHSTVRFQFTPPYMTYGWAAFFIGAIGFAWQVFLVIRHEGRGQRT